MPNPLSRRLRRRWLPQVVAVLLVVTQLPGAEPAAAQAPVQQPNTPAPATAAPPPPGPVQPVPVSQLPVEQNLTVRPLAGNGEMNDLQRHVMAPLVVQVVDQNERPMDGAQVVFRFPLNGPGATFAGGKTSATFRTNSGGQAAATNWMANGQVGTFEIHVSASYGNQEGETTVKMTNVTRIEEAKKAKGESLWSHRWFKVAVIGGAALAVGLGVYFATRGGGSGSGRTVGVTPGQPTVGSP